MYAQCPACKTVFGVTAAQLRAAAGRVRCGACGEVFNALETLRDELPEAARAAEPPELHDVEAAGLGAEDAAGEAPAFATPDENPSRPDDAPPVTPAEPPETLNPAAPGLGFVDPPEDDEQVIDFSLSERAEPTWDFDQAATGADEPASEAAEDGGDELPMALRSSDRQPRRRGWLVGCALLFVLIAAQLFWFNSGWLAAHVPDARPWLMSACQRLGCPLPVSRSTVADDTRSIRLLSRDVRYHPGLESALLVNATLNNEGSAVEPFPVLELRLFDTSGGLIGVRRFEPQDYLHDSVDAGGGLEPGQPVHIVLEIAATANAAVSFEFRFL